MEKKKLRICIVSNENYPIPAVRGGAIELLMQTLINDNEENFNCEFTVITIADVAVDYSYYKHTRFVLYNRIGKASKFFHDKIHGLIRHLTGMSCISVYPFYRKASNWLVDHYDEYDLAIAEGCENQVFKKVVKRFGKKKFVCHLHANFHSNASYESYYDHIFSVSKFVLDDFLSTKQTDYQSTHVIHNGCATKEFAQKLSAEERSSLRKSLGLTDKDFVIIFAGRIIPVKGVLPLVQAVIGMNQKDIKLVVIGSSSFEGAPMTEYQREVMKVANSCPDKIKFTGYVNHNELYKYLAISDVGTVPSFFGEDAFSLSLLEILAAGLPSIVAVSGGMTEVGTPDTTIFLTRDGDKVKKLRDAILSLYIDPDRRASMSRCSLKRSRQFDNRNFIEDFHAAVCSICYKTV